MSPKELLYIEDTLGHEQQIKTLCLEASSRLQDPQLKSFVSELSARHAECFNRFYSLLN